MDNHFDGVADFSAHSGTQAEAHSAKSAGSDELAGTVEMKILRYPHLMLAHVGGHNGVPIGQAGDAVEHFLGQEFTWDRLQFHFFVGEDIFFSFGIVVGGQLFIQHFQYAAGVADDVVVGEDIFINLSAININMYDFGVGSKMTR